MAVIGIDLGTTYCAVGHCVNGNPEVVYLDGEPTMPSVVGIQKNGKIAAGKIAKHNQAKYPQDTIVEIKRRMGEKVTVPLGGKQSTPQEISAMLLTKIKELAEAELGEEIEGVVISCPAYFKDPQRAATKEAGQLAGLNVMQIINEPTAAAYAYGVAQDTTEGEKMFLVYDLGGGTFDVTVIRMVAGMLEVLGTGGDPQLGGGDFDDRIVDWMMEHLEKIPGYFATLTDEKRKALKLVLKSYAEEGKKALCDSQDENPAHQFKIPKVDIFEGKPIAFSETLTKEEFEKRIDGLLENSLKWVDEALAAPKDKHHYTEEDITAILLVGGSTRVPLVQEKIRKRFPNTPIRGQESGINPDEIVALGAGIVAADIDPESDEVARTKLVDVTGHTLSVAVLDEQTHREVLSPIIPKETPIPYAAAHRFSSMGHGQSQCCVKVFQGEGREIDPEKVTMIGEFLIPIAPIQEPTPLRIGLDLDANGLLLAHATDELSGKRVDCHINYEDSAQMSPEELERKKQALDAQLKAVLQPTANPLDGQPAARPQPNAWAPQPGAGGTAGAPAGTAWPATPGAAGGMPGGMPAGGMPPGAQPASPYPPATSQPVDAAEMMNPVMRNLYRKAVNGFGKIPADRQPEVLQLVTEVENAARSGDQARLMSYFPRLQQLLQGVP